MELINDAALSFQAAANSVACLMWDGREELLAEAQMLCISSNG